MRRFFHFTGMVLITVLAVHAAQRAMVLEDVLVIDGTGAKAKPHQSVVIEDGMIARIVNAQHVSDPPSGAQVIPLTGKTVMPGIINGHGHLGITKGATSEPDDYTEENIASQLSQYERYGVTTVMSLGFNKNQIYRIRKRQEKEQIGGASILTADRGIGIAGGAPKMNVSSDQVYRPATPESAREDVRAMAARRPDLIKVWIDDSLHTLPEPNPAIYGAAIDEAHKEGLRVAAHVFYQVDAQRLLNDKIDILAHSIRDEAVTKSTIHAIKSQKVYYIPTLGLEDSFFGFADQPEWMKSELFKQATDPALLKLLNSEAYRTTVQQDKTTRAFR